MKMSPKSLTVSMTFPTGQQLERLQILRSCQVQIKVSRLAVGGQQKVPAYPQQVAGKTLAKFFYTEPATHSIPSTEDTHAGKNPAQAAENPAQNSLSQEISRSFTQEFLETDPNTQALCSFLAERKLIDEYSANENISNMIERDTIDKICLNSNQPEENVKINEE